MSNDDERPRRQTDESGADGSRDCPAVGPCSEPVYAAVLQASGLRPPPGQFEREDLSGPPSGLHSAPAKSKPAVTTRLFMADGRPLRLIPGGRQADQADRGTPGAAERLPMDRDHHASGSQNHAAATASRADRSEGLGPVRAALAGGRPGARCRLQLVLPRNDADMPQQAPGQPNHQPGRHDQPGTEDLSRPPDRSRRHEQPGTDDHPDGYNRPGQRDQAGSHYLASGWEYAGARAAARAGRHRQPGHPERDHPARQRTERNRTDRTDRTDRTEAAANRAAANRAHGPDAR